MIKSYMHPGLIDYLRTWDLGESGPDVLDGLVVIGVHGPKNLCYMSSTDLTGPQWAAMAKMFMNASETPLTEDEDWLRCHGPDKDPDRP